MSYNTDKGGLIVEVPETYNIYDVKINNSSNAVTSIDGTVLTINMDKVNERYQDKAVNKIMFPNKHLYVKYILEFAVQKQMYPNLSEVEQKNKARIFAFNPTAITKGELTGYSTKLLSLIRESELDTKFDVLNMLQIAEFPAQKGFHILTLGNRRDLDGAVATEYASQLEQLADPTVQKVADKALNYEISEYFSIFPEVLVYQHGLGFSMNGINLALPQSKLMNKLIAMGDTYLNHVETNGNLYNLINAGAKLLDKKEPVMSYLMLTESEIASYNMINPTEDITVGKEVEEGEGDSLQQQSTSVEVISEPYGVIVAETKPSEVKTQEFINIIQPQIQAQAYKENASGTANDMFMYGLRWTRKRTATKPLNNKSYANKGLPITDAKATDGYVYDTVDQNGNPLAPVSDLQPIINEIQNSLGVDMSNYDAVIGNIYLPGQNIATHRDTTESLSARNYPVIVYTIGNNSGIGIYEDKKNPGSPTFASDSKKTISTKNGTIYTFGMDGKGRFELAHDTPKGIKRDQKFPPITLPNGDIVENYTITLTFRRAADLEPGMPTTPAKLTTTQPSTSDTDALNRTLTQEELSKLRALPSLINNILTANKKTVASFGITQEEWNNLSDLEKYKFLECN
jgi:alkylated DNA repair dioxygenase AlkB